jgi:hypothetical protein
MGWVRWMNEMVWKSGEEIRNQCLSHAWYLHVLKGGSLENH